MKKNKIASIIIGAVSMICLAVSPGVAMASSNHGNSSAGDKVTICHRTGSNSNPYVRISPDVSGVYNGHYREHKGPVYPASGWGDIIPPFTYKGHTYSMNWNSQGRAIFNNGCAPAQGGRGGGPQKDCDGDYDHSPAAECQTTGGRGGGGTTTTVTTSTSGKVLGASTTGGGLGAGPQVAVVPTGSVNGGEGAASHTTSTASLVGLMGSLVGVGTGLSLLNRKQS